MPTIDLHTQAAATLPSLPGGQRGAIEEESTNNPIYRGKPGFGTPSFQGMEDALRDACERAMQLVFPLPTLLRLYRSVIGLTRALMQARVDVGLPPGLNEELVALLDSVRDTTGMHFPEPDMPMMDAIRVHQAMMALAKVAHLARDVAAIRPSRTGRIRLPSEATRPVEAEAIPEPEIEATPPVASRDDHDAPGWRPPVAVPSEPFESTLGARERDRRAPPEWAEAA
jgi:hypothetical protein